MSRHVPPDGGAQGALDVDGGERAGMAIWSAGLRESAGGEGVLLARVMSGEVVHSEQVLDRDTLADLVHEAIEHSQRARGANAQTIWFDAAAAADLILFHVTQLAGDPPPWP